MSKFIDLICWLLLLTLLIGEELVEGRMTPITVNKAIIKTIKVKTDEIIDFYYIYRQPSLNHPLLRNNSIQMAPSSQAKEIKSDDFGILELAQIWHKYGSCPEGTIPIRRNTKNYNSTILRKHNPPKSTAYKTRITSHSKYDTDGHEYATITVDGKFLGAQAKINLWEPITETSEMSISQIWISTGKEESLNTIEAGWEVDRNLYGDDHTRFFVYWTANGYNKIGCQNLVCDGFVHTSSSVSLGCVFTEMSIFNGNQKDATFGIHKDKSSGNWWVQLQGISVCYYPSPLFTELSEMGTRVTWGGEITNWRSKGRHTSTQMGSGHFPSEGGLKKSSYFNWVQVIDVNNVAKDPENVETIITNPNCYDLKIDNDHHDTNGYGFYYGGPGYNHNCQ